MEPARTIIARLGGPGAICSALGLAYTAPYRWTYAREKGGTGGLIPQRHHPALLQMARGLGIQLDPADFLPKSEVAPFSLERVA